MVLTDIRSFACAQSRHRPRLHKPSRRPKPHSTLTNLKRDGNLHASFTGKTMLAAQAPLTLLSETTGIPRAPAERMMARSFWPAPKIPGNAFPWKGARVLCYICCAIVCVCVCARVRACVHLCVCVCACVHASVRPCMCACARVWVCVGVGVPACVCTCGAAHLVKVDQLVP